MTKEEILALNLQKGERVLVEVDVFRIDKNSNTLTLEIGKEGMKDWHYDENIHSIRRVEKAELSEDEQPTVESNYVSLDEFHKRNQFARKIYAFQVAREFSEKGEEMPDDLRNEIAGYISKSPEIEQSPEEKTEVAEVEGVHYVLDVDGNKLRAGNKCVRVKYPDDRLIGLLFVDEIKTADLISVCGDNGLWTPSCFRKVN